MASEEQEQLSKASVHGRLGEAECSQPFPVKTSIPHAREWSILFRTFHLLAISILVGGHFFNAPADQLRPMLYLAIASGAAMAFVEAYPRFLNLFEGWGILVFIKLALLCAIPFAWSHRFAILVAVLVIGSAGSHMSKRLRHCSPLVGLSAGRFGNDE
jgi:hypothetical protein